GRSHCNCHRRTRGLRCLVGTAPADVPGGDGAVPAVLWGQPVYLQHGQPVYRQGTDDQGWRAPGPAPLHRPAAPGPGAHRHRHQLRHDRAVPGGAAGLAGPDRHRPRRWPGAQGM
ncbi:Na(+) H(+) antiporter subunit C, partial [Pseudomonas sp. FEN]